VVHIDLGIAFEQGRFLNTPELVPFRLTRDIVDGMGATGESQSITSLLSCNFDTVQQRSCGGDHCIESTVPAMESFELLSLSCLHTLVQDPCLYSHDVLDTLFLVALESILCSGCGEQFER